MALFSSNPFQGSDPNKESDTAGYKVYTDKGSGDTAEVLKKGDLNPHH
jgi:hypothetical protein